MISAEKNKKLMPVEEAHVCLLFLLKQINRICEVNKIVYLAHAGTLLGAVRHTGFIPWDDDMDLIMERKYYSAFVKACEESLPDEVLIRTRENDPFFCEEYVKICYKDDKFNYSDLAIDIFFLDETDPSRKVFRAFQNMVIKGVRPLKLYKVSRKCNYMGKYIPQNKIKHLLLQTFSFIPLKLLTNVQSWAMTADKHTSDYFVDWGSMAGYKRATRPKYFYAKPEKIPFENMYVYASKNRCEVLEFGYGKDYMTPPPPEKWHVHNVMKINNSRISYTEIKKEVKNNDK